MTWRTRKVTPAVAARDPVKEAAAAVAATRRVIRAAVLEMDPVKDLVPNLDPAKDPALNPARMMDTLEVTDLVMVLETGLVPRDIRAVALVTDLEMEAVPRDTRVLVPVMDLVPREALNQAPNLMMDTLEVVTAEETVEDLAAMMLLLQSMIQLHY